MLNNREFEFDDFQDNFTSSDGEFLTGWPSLRVDMTYKLHPPEPDVGIFGYSCEVTRIFYYLDDECFSDLDTFADAVYDRISNEIDETVESVVTAIKDQISGWEAELEEE